MEESAKAAVEVASVLSPVVRTTIIGSLIGAGILWVFKLWRRIKFRLEAYILDSLGLYTVAVLLMCCAYFLLPDVPFLEGVYQAAEELYEANKAFLPFCFLYAAFAQGTVILRSAGILPPLDGQGHSGGQSSAPA